jgi:malonate-semialdehyde dehydrogenase (acetylating)/methylmalonate-semialdehyde dehydrogenase
VSTTALDITHWIDGRSWSRRSPDRWGEVRDPASGEPLARVALASRHVIDVAVRACAAAQPGWAATPVADRVGVLHALRDLVGRRAGEVAELVTAEQGKTLAEAAAEVEAALGEIDAACAAPRVLRGELVDDPGTGADTIVLREPVGVCAGITPSDLPVRAPLAILAPALAAGNAVVLKPSEQDPSAALLVAELLVEAGLPEGVLNVVHGDETAVDALLDHAGIAAIAFAGSTPVARYVRQRAAAAGRRCRAVGGAVNHAVVLPDADLEAAADELVAAAYGVAGQRVTAITTAVAVGAAADRLVAAVADRARDLVVGPGADPATGMGPLISARARERVLDHVAQARGAGATVVLDGRRIGPAGHVAGFFLGPCLLDGVQPAMGVHREEVFGPVLGILRAGSLDDALAALCAAPGAGGAALFTADGAAARRFRRDVQRARIGLNVAPPERVPDPAGMRFYTRSRVVAARWSGPRNAADSAPA